MNKLYACLIIIGFFVSCTKKEEKSHSSSILSMTPDSVYQFTLGSIAFKVDPKVGGRIVSLQRDGKEFLTGKETDEINFGSTLWPSPQTLWNWPPLTTLDSQPYSVVDADSNRLLISSSIDPKLGIQFMKEFSLERKDTSVHITYSIKNLSDTAISVGPWEITRVAKGGLYFFPKGTGGLKSKNASMDMMPFTESDNIFWYLNDANQKMTKSQLTVADGSEGWVAYAKAPFLFIKKFENLDTTWQTRGEAEVEGYVSMDKSYIEVEVQGPYKKIKPGETSDWKMVWFLKNADETEIKTGNLQLAEKIRAYVQ